MSPIDFCRVVLLSLWRHPPSGTAESSGSDMFPLIITVANYSVIWSHHRARRPQSLRQLLRSGTVVAHIVTVRQCCYFALASSCRSMAKFMKYPKYATTVICAYSVPDWYEALDRLVAVGQLSIASMADAQFRSKRSCDPSIRKTRASIS